jgi:hypothetical protein
MRIDNIKNYKEKLLFLFILLIFFIFGAYMIFRVIPGIPPDENYHINISSFYSETILIPPNSEKTYPYRDITRIPYLSFWLNARLINLNFTEVEDYVILRFFNLIISVGSLLVVYLISKEVINKKYYNLFPAFLLANTLMFVFLSSAVSYDNLSNLFIFLTIYFFVKYFKYKKSSSFLYLLSFQVLALLTKFTVIPVVVIELILLINSRIRFGNVKNIITDIFKRHKVLLSITAILIILGFFLYGINFLKYGEVRVGCDNVLTTEQCMQSALFARNANLEKLSFRNFSELKKILKARITPSEYISNWVFAMFQRIFGILAHRVLLMDKYFVNIYLFLFSVLTFITLRKWNRKDSLETRLIILSMFYILVLLIFQNYKSYFETNIFSLALQGRYLFPVLPVVYIILIRYLSEVKAKWVRVIVVNLLILVFLLGCIPFFFTFVPVDWFVS